MANVYLGNMLRIPAFVKIAEIIFLIIIICIAEAGDVEFLYHHSSALGYGIVIGYLIVYLILIICYLIGETGTQRSKFELLLNAVGFVLFFSLSIYIFVKASDFPKQVFKSFRAKAIVEGVFLLMVALCQVLDAVFIFRRSSE